MSAPLPDPLRDLAALQRGIITRRQALAAGLTDDLIESWIARGRWQRVYPGVYATFTGVLARESALWAVVLFAGEGAVLSYETAAELDGLTDRPAAVMHVTIPSRRRVAPVAGIVVHRRHDAEAAAHPARLPPRTRIEETVLDLADCSPTAEAAVSWVTAALGRRLTTQPKLHFALGQRSQARWRRDLHFALSPDLAGVHSLLEYHYVRDVEVPHRLPRGIRQAPGRQAGRRVYRDVLYDEYGLIVELDGRSAHPDEARWADVLRDNLVTAAGQGTLRYGYWQVRNTPCMVAAQVAAALQSRGWPSRPHPCTPSCPLPRRVS